MFNRSIITTSLCLAASLILPAAPGFARNQWDINHGGNNPPVDPNFVPGGKYSGYVPKFTPDFWQGMTSNKIPTGTILTAIVEDTISSLKNKPGDTFVLTIQDGFQVNGQYLVPAHSKIIGTINSAVSAKLQKSGMPGKVDVSLQSLVFPDGRHVPIFAFIDSNPNFNQKAAPKVRHLGHDLHDYGEMVAGMAMSFISGPGFMMKRIHGGSEFVLPKGEAVAVRLTRGLNLPSDTTVQPAIKPPPLPKSVAARSPRIIDPSGPVTVPGLVDPSAPVGEIPAPAPPPQAATPGLAEDENAVFNQPLHTPAPSLNGLPDPF